MVYQSMTQLRKYYARDEQHLTTTQHFLDNPSQLERPGGGGPSKKSTSGMLFSGSHFFSSGVGAGKGGSAANKSTLSLTGSSASGTSKSTTSLPSLTYRGNGDFIVELPHSTITYRSLRMTPSSQLTSWKTEYGSEYTKKKPSPGGYSTLSTRRA